MKISQLCAVVLVLVMGSVMAFADGVKDPKIIIKGASGDVSCPPQGCRGVGLNFSFKVPQSGSGSVFFTNESGQDWTSLTLIERGVPAADIKCSTSLFTSCTAKTMKNGAVEILLSGVRGKGNARSNWYQVGIPNGASFYIQFACIKNGCWPGGLSFGGHANGAATVPEPGTMALLVTGLGAMVSRRKMWKSRWNS